MRMDIYADMRSTVDALRNFAEVPNQTIHLTIS